MLPRDSGGGSRRVVGPRRRPRRTPPRPASRPTGAFGGLPGAALQPQQRAAHRRTVRAQAALPKRPVPSVPIIRHPTPTQTRAAQRVITNAVNRQLGGTHGAERQRRRDEVYSELATDPRHKATRRVIRHYARAQAENDALKLARRMGVKGVSRATTLAAGRILQAHGVGARRRDIVLPGRAPTVLRTPKIAGFGAALNLTNVNRAILGATSLGKGDTGPDRLVRKIGADLKTLGEAPFVGGYTLGRAVVSDRVRALRGQQPKGLAGETGTAVGGIARGVAENVAHEVTHPRQAFSEHPLLTALDALGAASVVGRVGGAAARGAGSSAEAGGVRGAVARVGSTARSPIATSSDAGAVKAGAYAERKFSKDLTRKAVQAFTDASREPVRDAAGDVVTVKQRGRTVPVLQAHPGERDRALRREGNFRAARANARERTVRDVTAKETNVGRRRGGVRGDRAQSLVAMVHEGTITSAKHFEQDVTAELGRLKGEYAARIDDPAFRHSGEADAARAKIGLLEDALTDPKILRQKDRIVAEGVRQGAAAFERERRAQGAAMFRRPRSALDRARMTPVLVSHLKGRHHTEAEHAALEQDARRHETAAEEKLKAATTPADRVDAARELLHAREERIAVSGREPGRVVAHEDAKRQAGEARAVHQAAQAKVARLHAKRQRLIGAQSSRRGSRGARGGGAAATKAERGKLAKVDAEIKQAKAAELDARRERGKAEQKARQTPLPKQQAGIRAPGGRFLATSEAEEFLRSRGRDPETVGFLPHRMDVRGARAHHTQLRPGTRPVLDKPEGRTGEAHRKGATESSAELIRDAGMRVETQLVKAEELDALVRDHGVRHPAVAKAERGEPLTRHERDVVKAGGYFGGKEATELAQRIEFDVDRSGRTTPYVPGPNGEKWTPMRAHAGSLSEQSRLIIQGDLQGPGAMESLGQHLLNDRILTKDELAAGGARNVVLVPTTLVKQLEAHLRPAGEIQKLFQMLNRPFRFAVLAQPRWLAGNFIEPYFVRLPAAGSGAINVFGMGNDIRIATKIVKQGLASNDPAVRRAAQQIAAQQFGGLFIGGRGASNRRAFADSKLYGRMVARLPATRQFAELAHKVGKVLIAPGRAYFWVNRAGIEQWTQRAAFGRQARHDMQEFFGSWTKAQRFGEQATAEALRGLVNTPTQRRFMEAQHELLGQYEGFGPRLRAAVQGPMPFLPWALSAARFVYWTMPLHHTALTATLIKVNDVVSKEWQAEHADTPPGTLRLAQRTKKGGFVDLARYTPYGLTAPIVEGETQVATDQFLPQFSGAYAALGGRDPFDRELMLDPSENKGETKAGAGQRAGVAAYGLAESLVPYLATARRLRERGGTAYAGSTVWDPDVKPGSSHMSAFRRTLYPFRPTYLTAPSSGGKGLAVPRMSRLDEALSRIQEAQDATAAQDSRIDEALERLQRRAP
jgi:hypothetical protein